MAKFKSSIMFEMSWFAALKNRIFLIQSITGFLSLSTNKYLHDRMQKEINWCQNFCDSNIYMLRSLVEDF
jgi:hypothetical protein